MSKRIRIVPELRKQIAFTVLGVVLFRLLALVPVFDVSEEELHEVLAGNPLLGGIDLLAGGEVLGRFSLVGAGIFPAVLAAVLVEIASWLPPLRELRERGDAGKKRLAFYRRLLTVLLAFLVAWLVTRTLSRGIGLLPGEIRWFTSEGFASGFTLIAVFTLGSLLASAVSAYFISARGVYDGDGVLLLTGALFGLGRKAVALVGDWSEQPVMDRLVQGAAVLVAFGLCLFLVLTVRRVPIAHARAPRPRPRVARQGELPLRFVYGGILPVSAAIGLLALIGITQELVAVYLLGQEEGLLLRGWIEPGSAWYWLALATLVVVFTYTTNYRLLWYGLSGHGASIARTLKETGAFVPGVRPGRDTDAYLSRVMARLSAIGAATLVALAAVLPGLVFLVTGHDPTMAYLSLFVAVEHAERLRRRVHATHVTHSYETLFRR